MKKTLSFKLRKKDFLNAVPASELWEKFRDRTLRYNLVETSIW